MEQAGNKNSVWSTLGSSVHAKHERALHDYYATDPKALERLLDRRAFAPRVWECACGGGHLTRVLRARGYEVYATDLVKRGNEDEAKDFLGCYERWNGDIITNPPYRHAQDFVEKALSLVNDGSAVCMFLRIQFLEGKRRRELFKIAPPKEVWVSTSRLKCGLGGNFERGVHSSAICYAWFVWEKGWTGDPIIKWFN